MPRYLIAAGSLVALLLGGCATREVEKRGVSADGRPFVERTTIAEASMPFPGGELSIALKSDAPKLEIVVEGQRPVASGVVAVPGAAMPVASSPCAPSVAATPVDPCSLVYTPPGEAIEPAGRWVWVGE